MEPQGAFLARYPCGIGLPRYCGGSASTLDLSRPARCSLAFRPVRTADPLQGPFLGVLQAIRRLLTRPECFRLEREFAGPGFHRGGWCTLARHTQQLIRARTPAYCDLPKSHWRFPLAMGGRPLRQRQIRRRHGRTLRRRRLCGHPQHAMRVPKPRAGLSRYIAGSFVQKRRLSEADI